MGNFTFGGISTVSSKKGIWKDTKHPHLYSSSNNSANPSQRHLLFITETFPTKEQLQVFIKWIEKQIDCSLYAYTIISASSANVSYEEIKKTGITKFYKEFRSDIKNYIFPNKTLIIPMGAALQALTLSADIHTGCFYDIIFNKSYFYSPYTETYVFPIDSFNELFIEKSYGLVPADASRMYFAKFQLDQIDRLYEELKIPPTPSRLRIIKLKTPVEVTAFLQEWAPKKVKMAWDLETDGFDFLYGKIGCFTCSFGDYTGYYLPFSYINLSLFEEFLKTKTQIGQNLKFDIKFLQSKGIFSGRIDSDTLLLAQVLNENRYNGLKSLAYYYTLYGGYNYELDDALSKLRLKNYLELPEDILAAYATKDAIITFLVEEEMQKQLTELDKKFPPPYPGAKTLRYYYENVKLPAARVFVDIEREGVYIDKKKWDQNSDLVTNKIIELKKKLAKDLQIQTILKKQNFSFSSFTPISDKDLSDIFLDDIDQENKELQSPQKLGQVLEALGWSDQGRSKQGFYLTGEEQLSRWELEGHSEASDLKELRAYRTLQKTFLGTKDSLEGWRAYLKQHPDGSYRIHPSYRVMGTESGRNACVEPNFQQIPATSIGAPLFKQIISVPNPENYYIVTIDYSSLQMRLAAIDSEDPVLFNSYLQDSSVDMHVKTAYNIFVKDGVFDIEEIEVEDADGKKYVFLAEQTIQIKRDNQIIQIKAKDLKETDILLSY